MRARDLGPAAVLNVANRDRVDEVTGCQKRILFPLLAEELDGTEGRILDFGCGTGRFTVDLAAAIQGEAIGVDPTAGLLQHAPSGPGVTYAPMKPGTIPLPPGSVDVVWTVLVLGAIAKPRALRRTAREIERVLRPGGLLFLAENTSMNSEGGRWIRRPVAAYRSLFESVNLRTIGTYEDVDETITILAGRRLAQTARAG